MEGDADEIVLVSTHGSPVCRKLGIIKLESYNFAGMDIMFELTLAQVKETSLSKAP